MRTVCVQRVTKALFIRTKQAVHSLPACDVFHNPDWIFFFFFFYGCTVRRLCVPGTNLGQRKHNEFRACALLVPNVRLALVWRSSGVYIHTWKNADIFGHAENVRRGGRAQKMNNAHRAFSSNHQRILTHAQRITKHWPKFFKFCALDVRDGMCAWAFKKLLLFTSNNQATLFSLCIRTGFRVYNTLLEVTWHVVLNVL